MRAARSEDPYKSLEALTRRKATSEAISRRYAEAGEDKRAGRMGQCADLLFTANYQIGDSHEAVRRVERLSLC
jgi:hypothetical protein